MDEKSKSIIEQIEDALQQMEHIASSTQLKVPHGIMSYARTYQKQLSFLNNRILKKNISYLLMLNDFLSWAVKRFSLVPRIKDMLMKNIITNFGFAIEGINKSLAKNIIGKKDIGFDASSSILCEKGIISKIMKKEIRWIYDIRSRQHYDTLTQVEFEHYTYRDCKKAQRIFNYYIQQIQEKLED